MAEWLEVLTSNHLAVQANTLLGLPTRKPHLPADFQVCLFSWRSLHFLPNFLIGLAPNVCNSLELLHAAFYLIAVITYQNSGQPSFDLSSLSGFKVNSGP